MRQGLSAWLIALIAFPALGYASASQDFNGTTDIINCTSNSSVDDIFQSGGTVAAWIMPDTVGENGFGRVAHKQTSSNPQVGWTITLCNSDATNCPSAANTLILIRSWSTATLFGRWRIPANGITLDTWQHVAVVYNDSSTSNDPIFYVNGVSQTVTEVTTPSGTRDSDAAEVLYVGNRSDTTRTFDGSIAYVHAYSRALSAVEINEIMYHPGSILTNLVLYQPILGTDGLDLSGTGNNCTVTGTTAVATGPPIFLAARTP